MSLSAGTRLGPYEILAPLGAGGMGEVYRAKDMKLGREVAIKILPNALTHDPERLARFEREARVLASLNHSNIAQIYAVEQDALVMELVEGESLKGPLPLDTALNYARQIAAALEVAHEKGIIHRDLKPSNIMVTPEGVIKVLDFGLAAIAQDPSSSAVDPANSPTLTISPTRAGMILGTAAYMAPEQARGTQVDKRADIWAFGAVVFELLTGRQAFPGETITDILAAVLKSEPDYSLLPADLPPRIDYLLKRCLRKKRSERLRDIGEARIWIDEAGENIAAITPRARLQWIPLVGLLTFVILSAAVLWWTLSHRAAPAWTGAFLGGPSNALGPRISPDGNTLAFQAMVNGLLQVAVMKPANGNWAVLTHEREQGGVQEITWSPDGTKLYYSRVLGSPRGIFSIPVLGGEERLVLEGAANPEMLPDGSLLVLKINAKRRFQIHHYWPESGKLEPLPATIAVTDISAPLRTFPDGKEAAYFGRPAAADDSAPEALYALDLQTGVSRRLAPGLVIPPPPEGMGFPMAITADGRKVLLGLTEGDLRTLVAVPRTGSGAPETWLNVTQNAWYLDVGRDGTLYMDQLLQRPEALRFPPGGGRPERLMHAVAVGPILQRTDGTVLASAVFAGHTRVAAARPGGDLTPLSETREETDVSITNAGERMIAFPLGPPGKRVIAIASLPDGRIVRRLAVGGGTINGLASSPDGRTIFYVSGHAVWSMPAAGGDPTKISEGDSVAASAGEVVVKLNANDGFHLMRVPPAGGEPVRVPPSAEAALTSGMLSPAAVGPNGRVLVQVNEPHVWFYRMAAIDLRTGHLDLIPTDYGGDIWFPGWTPDGKIVAVGLEYSFSLWQMKRKR
jgi:eukaryotic-like serine/threonine-protein kinase